MHLLGRILRYAAYAAGGLVVLVVLLLAAILVGTNTGPGRHLIETEASSLTGGTVTIAGLRGRFPDRLRVGTVTLSDTVGPYVTLHDLALDWHPLSLVHELIDVDRLAASSIVVARLPAPSPAPRRPAASKGGGFSLPFGLRLADLSIDRVALGAPVIGHAAAVSLGGHAAIASLAPILAGFSLDALPRGTLGLSLVDLAGHGHYALGGAVAPGTIRLALDATEDHGGLVAALARSDALDPLTLHLALDGPTRAEALRLALDAGPLTARGRGTVDLAGRAADLDLSLHAPAMTPTPGVSWRSVALDAHIHGPFARPALAGTLDAKALAAGGASIGDLAANLAGDRGQATVHAVLSTLAIPGPKPDLFASSPVTVDAHAVLDDPARPVTFRVAHALLALDGTARTAGPRAGHLVLTVPALAPFAAIGGTALEGHATLTADASQASGATTARVRGTVGITGGQPQAVALLGADATLALDATLAGSDVTLRDLAVRGHAVSLDASGTRTAQGVDARAHLALPVLADLSPAVSGDLLVDLAAHGPPDALAADLHASGDVGGPGIRRGPITLAVAATALPRTPDATVSLGGRLDGAAVTLAAHARRDAAGATTVHVAALDWKSLHGRADLALAPGATIPTGTLDLRMARLADLSSLAHRSLAGTLAATLALDRDVARIDVRAGGLAASGARVGTLALKGTVARPQTAPDLDLALVVGDAGSGAIRGVSARATARGTLAALGDTLVADVPDLDGAPAHLALADTVDLPKHEVTLRALDATWHGEAAHLAAAARIAWAPEIAVHGFRLALAPPGGAAATVAADGTVSPRLALVASLQDVTPALAAPFAPTLKAAGRIDAGAHLTGTTARPGGTITVTAQGLRLLSGPAASLRPASLRARAVLAGEAARIDASLEAGPDIDLRVAGTAPIRPAGALALRADGRIDLAVANPILEQQGRHVSGSVTLDATASGTLAHPALGGSVTLANGDVQDFAQGAHLSHVDALVALEGQTLRIERFAAAAGNGTIEASGTAGVLVPGLPVDVRLVMHDASPIASDLLTASLDADIAASGSVAGGLRVGGRLAIERADINIPNSLPSSVATLHVIKPGEKPPAPAGATGASAPIALDLALDAPGEIFVRGHGLDAVLGGHLHVGGTSTAPLVSGAFTLRRGTFSLAGTSLTFTRGTVGFNGATNGKIDPSLDFIAESSVNQYVADLTVGGYASKPTITLSSTPPLPQDQVLALILFGTETSNLSPFQIAEIATALASLTGGGGFDPLSAVRNTLGLDRLSVGSGNGNGGNTGASVEGGKYVTKHVYVGARESTAGGGTQAVVQIDLTKRLKAFTVVGTGGAVTGATTPENDPGSSVGLKYQFRY